MKDLICNQTKIPKEQWRYGFRSSAATGCGWIATYNALRLMGYHPTPERLICYYERQLPLLHGNAGTSFWGPVQYFKRQGFPVETTGKRAEYDQLVRRSDVCILFYHWRKGWRLGAHFVALQQTEQGIVGYNTFRSSSGPDYYGESLEQFLKKHKYFGTFLIGIQNK